ncbi:MAG: Rab family GTPase, partial [Candidatus Hodarchaeales archaeon]
KEYFAVIMENEKCVLELADLTILSKIVLLGDPAVGKTTLRDVFIGHTFETKYLPTLGADYLAKNVLIDGRELRLQIWYLAGQSSFKEVRRLYYRNSIGALLVFDITNLETLSNLKMWCKELLTYSKAKNITVAILGNKIDLKDKKWVDQKQIDDVITSIKNINPTIHTNIFYLKNSALTGENVELAFKKLTKNILSNHVS